MILTVNTVLTLDDVIYVYIYTFSLRHLAVLFVQ